MATRVVSPILVGRAEQLAALDAALAEAGRGHPSAVLVGGEAGVGKTRLVSEFAERSSGGSSVRVLTGGCLELGADGVPFAPFTSVLRELVRELGTDGVAALLPGGTTKELARLLPEFGEPAGTGDAGEVRTRLFEQVLNLLEQLAERQPVVLVIEDAHWADRSSRDLLTFLIRNLPGQFAQAIGAHPVLVPRGRAAVEQAHHWYAARDWTWGLVSAWQAAAEAGRALAYAEQLAMLSRVLELWEQVPGAAQRIGADHATLLEAAVQAAELAGDFDRGIAFATAAVRELEAAEPARAGLLHATRGQLKFELGRANYEVDLREAVRLVPADPPSRARARVLEALAHSYHHRTGGWDTGECQAIAEEAVAVARQAGDAATEAAALTDLACALPPGGNLERIRALLAEARAVATPAKAYGPLLRAAITESDVLEGMGQHELAAMVAREGIAAASQYGLARTRGAVLAINLAEPLVSLGRWDEAAEVIERALQLFPTPLRRSSLTRLASDIALARGDLASAADSVASISAALGDTRYKDETHLPLTRLETELRLAQGRPGAAISTVGDALDSFSLVPSPRYAWPLLVAGARACAAASSARQTALVMRAVAVRDRLRAEAGKLDVEGIAQPAHQLTFAAEAMRADRVAPAAEAGLGDGPQPGDLCVAWDRAAEAWETLDQPYPLAIALSRSAEAALSAGDHDGGATRLRRAAALAQRLGARPLNDGIARLAERARIGLGTDVPGRERLGLTARELEVLRLVTAGRSNREIAGELFISVKTASVHVSNILGKLGVGSRGEAAATAYRLGLFESLPTEG